MNVFESAKVKKIFGKNAVAVSSKEQLELEIKRWGDRRTLRQQDISLIGLTNGSDIVTGLNTPWADSPGTVLYNGVYRVDDLIRFRNEQRFYKIKLILGGGQIQLYEPYKGTSTSSVSETNTDIGFLPPDIINSTGANFGAFSIGEEVTVTGSASNDGVYTVASVSGGGSSITTVEKTLNLEFPGASMTVARTKENATVGFYYLDWVTFMLMPFQDYYFDAIDVYPGQAFQGAGGYSTVVGGNGVVISEGQETTTPYPFGNWGENRACAITFAPTLAWSSFDAFVSAGANQSSFVDTYYKWAGQESILNSCEIHMLNLGGSHGGGLVGCVPLNIGGISRVINCK